VSENKDLQDQIAEKDTVEPEHIVLEYGLPVDSFIIETGKIKRNQNLSYVLIKNGISPKIINEISKQKKAFDVKKIRYGHKYKLLFSKDSIKELKYFIYEHTLTEYVRIKLFDTIMVEIDEKPTTIIKKTASGIINTNLWNAMVDNNINPMMSIELSEIYAWSIDFFGLQKKDEFYVIYSEKYVDSISAGIEHIDAVLFKHKDENFYAISFIQDGRESFFDAKGGSLKRAFLKAPLRYSHISSRFSKSRMHPVLKIRRPHSGVDYAAPTGTPVHSIGDGFVVKKGYQKNGAGNYIKIKHNSVYTTQYAHLNNFAKGLKIGTHVKQGQTIGYVGKTGLATGPHLDFRFFKNGVPVDPLKVYAPPVEPIKKINLLEFNKVKDKYISDLNSIEIKEN
jgi:murein DD-endopeptidase MepM/ murein hydrolase activator NlpD